MSLTFRTWELLLIMEISHIVDNILVETKPLHQQDNDSHGARTTTTTTLDLNTLIKRHVKSFLPRFPDEVRLQPNQTKIFPADWPVNDLQIHHDPLNTEDRAPTMISIFAWPSIHDQDLREFKSGNSLFVTYPNRFCGAEDGIAEVVLSHDPDLEAPCRECGQVRCSPADCVYSGQVPVLVKTRQLIRFKVFYEYFALPHLDATCNLPPLRAISIDMRGSQGCVKVEWNTNRNMHMHYLSRAGIEGVTADEHEEYEQFGDANCSELFVEQINGSWVHIKTDKEEEATPGSFHFEKFQLYGVGILTAEDMEDKWTAFENLGCLRQSDRLGHGPRPLRGWIRRHLEDILDIDGDY